jgi:hypothetical protein
VHHYLISAFGINLTARIAPRYVVRIEERVVPLGDDDPAIGILVPDVAIHDPGRFEAPTGGRSTAAMPTFTAPILTVDEVREAYIEIRAGKDGRIVTVMEVLSPANKVVASGVRNAYLEKRNRWLNSSTHFVEIDLLRGGTRISPPGVILRPTDYRIVISPVEKRPMADYWFVYLHRPLPIIPIPLAEGDEPVSLELQEVFTEVYDRARYDLQIDYRADPPPPDLASADKEWLNDLLVEKGKRSRS